jgi:prepilin-type N-terminal cleavage/methylation domain-containing protein
MIHHSQPFHKGFTLVETLVAVTILVTAIVGPLYVVHKSVMASYTARDVLIATALSQEGVEMVRSIRDGNYLSNNGNWLAGLDVCIVDGPGDYGCTHGPVNIQACPSTGCPVLLLNTLHRYNIAAGVPTRFTRTVRIEPVSSTEARVTVTVSWLTLRIPYTVRVTEELYDWQ